MIIEISDLTDPLLQHYTSLKDVALRSIQEPATGIYLAESSTVIRRALAAGHRPISLLMARKWLPSMADVIAILDSETPVFVGDDAVLTALTGFHLHRGAIAAMERPIIPSAESLIRFLRDSNSQTSRIAIFEDIVDHTNLGALFRSAAALGIDAVLITPSCADPLYRRSIRVSMGTIFQVPWARLANWPADISLLHDADYVVAALGLTNSAVPLVELSALNPSRLALILGNEGHGLRPQTLAAADMVVKIPMSHGVDSLNVAAASAVAFYATSGASRHDAEVVALPLSSN